MAKSQKGAERRGAFKRLNFRDRIIIENRYCVDRKPLTSIAKELNRHLSTVIREIAGRPRIGRGKYSADAAQARALGSSKKQGRKSKFGYAPLKQYVGEKLKLGWSPEQVEIRLPIDYPRDKKMRISYEAIYRNIYSQIHRGGNGAVKENCDDLRKYLPRRHTRRRKKGFRKAQKLERDSFLPSIENRPKEVDKRKIVGHWEDDTLVSKKSAQRIKSVNERVSGIVFFGKTADGTAGACDKVVISRLKSVPNDYAKTLTRDRGSENFNYKTIEKELNLSCFFAHSYCSHERGSNENTNGLFRRYFPKGTDFGKITDRRIAEVEYLINTRPRKRHCGLTPYEIFYQKTGVALET